MYQNIDSQESVYRNAVSIRQNARESRASQASRIESLYDIPKSFGVAVAPPTACPKMAVHKYVNASTQFVRMDGYDRPRNSHIEVSSPASSRRAGSPLMERRAGQSPERTLSVERLAAAGGQQRQQNIYDIEPMELAEEKVGPQRPFKPRNLSDNALDEGMCHNALFKCRWLQDLKETGCFIGTLFEESRNREIYKRLGG